MKEAIILAGGKGTRLASILEGKPKPLVPINGVPLIQIQIELLLKYGYEKIYVLAQYQINDLRIFLNNKFPDIIIEIIKDGDVFLGSGGCIINSLKLFKDQITIIYGDTYLDVDLEKLIKFHEENDADLTLFTHPNNHPQDSDIIKEENNLVLSIQGYPHDKNFYSNNLVNAALYILNTNILKLINWEQTKLDFAKDIIPQLLQKGFRVLSYKSIEYIKDCGTPERHEKIEKDILLGIPKRLSGESQIPCVFIDRDGTIIENVDHLNSTKQLKLINNSARAISSLNNAGVIVAMITNQPVIARGELSFEGLNDIHAKLEWELGKKGAYLDDIKYCPHHPDNGFDGEVKKLKKVCACRKPGTKMIEDLLIKYNIRREESYIIGDSTSDIQCGENIGIQSILVQTGIAGLDFKYQSKPDYIFKNLDQAANFITIQKKEFEEIFSSLAHHLHSKTISISGVSRSGKSTFSSALKNFIQKRYKVKAHILRLDEFMLPKNKRGNFPYIYDYGLLKKLLDERKKFRKIKFNERFYNHTIGELFIFNKLVEILPEDILILEGLMAVDLGKDIPNNTKLFIETNSQVVRKRFSDLYSSRGFTDIEIDKLYAERKSERDIINLQKLDSITIKL